MSTGSLDKSPQSHISLIYCLNLSMNSVQPRGKQRDNYNLTRTSTSPVTLSYFHHGVGRDGGGGRREEGGEGLHLLQQSLSPPVALSLPPPPPLPTSPLSFQLPRSLSEPSCRPLLCGGFLSGRALAVTLSVIAGLPRWHLATNKLETRRRRPSLHALCSATGYEPFD